MKTAKMMAMAAVLAAAMVLMPAMAQAVPPVPALYVNMDNTEVSGTTITAETGQVGTVVGNAAMGAAGRIGEAVQLNGAGRIDFSANLGLGPSYDQPWTHAFWFSTTWTGAEYAMQNQSADQSAILYNYTGISEGGLGLWNMGTTSAPIAVAQDGTWTHVAWTYDGSTVRTYQNGVLVDTIAASLRHSPGGYTNIAWRIGGEDVGGGLAESKIDDFRIYTVALTDGQVAQLALLAKLTASQPGTLNFGDVPVDGTSTLYSAITLSSTGYAGTTVDLQGAFFDPGSDPFDNIISGDPDRDLAKGESESFTLLFNAAGLLPGLYETDITFQNDSPQGAVTYHLLANVVGGAVPEPAGLGLIGVVLLALRKRRS